MKTTIIPIGNSRGVRIPKPLLEESGLAHDVEIFAKKGEIKIIASRKRKRKTADTAIASENLLARDWARQEEDEAGANL